MGISPFYRGAIAASTQPPVNLGPYDLPNTFALELWMNAQTDITGSPGVTAIGDLSGNGNNTTTITGAPIISSAAYNGHDAIAFTNNQATIPDLGPSSAWTVWVVATTTADSQWVNDSSNKQFRVLQSNAQTMSFFNGQNPISATLPSNSSNLNIYTWRYDSGTLLMHQNGSLLYNGSAANNSFGINRLFVSSTGEWTDTIIYSTYQANSDVNTLGSELASYYNLSWTNV